MFSHNSTDSSVVLLLYLRSSPGSDLFAVPLPTLGNFYCCVFLTSRLPLPSLLCCWDHQGAFDAIFEAFSSNTPFCLCLLPLPCASCCLLSPVFIFSFVLRMFIILTEVILWIMLSDLCQITPEYGLSQVWTFHFLLPTLPTFLSTVNCISKLWAKAK